MPLRAWLPAQRTTPLSLSQNDRLRELGIITLDIEAIERGGSPEAQRRIQIQYIPVCHFRIRCIMPRNTPDSLELRRCILYILVCHPGELQHGRRT
jgi:hypothetical protein